MARRRPARHPDVDVRRDANTGDIMTVCLRPDVAVYPDLDALTVGLTDIFAQQGLGGNSVVVLEREPNVHASTFPSEIVTCLVNDLGRLRLFCKYSARVNHSAHGHRGGVAYEAAVYQRILATSGVSLPRCYGSYTEPLSNRTWLALAFLDNCTRASKVAGSAGMLEAAAWLGRFHAVNQHRATEAPWCHLKSYDSAYYTGWTQRTALFGARWHHRFPWLRMSCQRFNTLVSTLLEAPLTVIHGEFYPNNILYRGGRIYPVDWESAAIAAGEIDLASLTEHWPAHVAQKCALEYAHARWGEDIPDKFEHRLAVARLYLLFRWLGDRLEWTSNENALRRVRELGKLASRLQLI